MELNVDDRGNGPAIVLLHGQPGQIHDWDRVVPELVEDHRVVVPDRPGYGRSAGPATGLFDGADVLAADLRARGVEGAVVVGHSYGGGVALALASRHPDLVAGLVLAASIGSAAAVDPFDRIAALPLVSDAIAYIALQILPPWLLRIPVDLDVGSGSDLTAVPKHRLTEKIDLWRRRSIWRSFATEQRALVAESDDLTHALSGIEQVAIVLSGTRDRLVRPAAARDLTERLPGARLELLAGAGHLLPYHRPDAIVAAVREVSALTFA
ncbi:MAG TPA: alpha/beta hydrolase [Acidimicrobiales bacterium]|nr:alpha/beta hydrolase [Acidimicrobiales bacterium]